MDWRWGIAEVEESRAEVRVVRRLGGRGEGGDGGMRMRSEGGGDMVWCGVVGEWVGGWLLEMGCFTYYGRAGMYDLIIRCRAYDWRSQGLEPPAAGHR